MNQRTAQPYSEFLGSWPFAHWTKDLTNCSQSSGLSIWEEEEEVVVEASLPGIKNDQIHVVFEKGTLTIHGTKRETKEDKAKKYYQKSDATFQYFLKIPGEVDEAQEPHASLKDGILEVRFKKHKRSTPRKISVQNG